MRQPFSLFSVFFFSGFFLSCERNDPDVIDPPGLPPQLLQSSLAPAVVDTDTINIGPERLPTDILQIRLRVSGKFVHPLGQGRLSPPRFSLLQNRRDEPLVTGILTDDGLAPDATAGDSIYSAFALLRIARSKIGLFYVEIMAEDKEGNRSNTALLAFSIIRLNQPPVLSNLKAPDTVHTGSQASFLVSVKATDPNGQADIRSVTRTTPSNLVLPLNDSGLNGDAVPGDSIYTETVSLTPPPPPGPYEFRFRALDRSNAGSIIIYHTIVVTP